jgi:2-polyprenyl-6-methoxyphenol hydroxylase-like FAD-dependent oxidoreductase
MSTHYDALIIGSGPAGPFLAACLVEAGMQVALVAAALVALVVVRVRATDAGAAHAQLAGLELGRRSFFISGKRFGVIGTEPQR